MNKYEIENYNINYPKIDKIINPLIIELIRLNLYLKLQKKLKKLRIKYNTNFTDQNKSLSEMLALDLLSIFIFNHKFKSNIDPLFDCESPFTKLKIIKYFYEKKCLRNLTDDTINIIIKIFPKISKTYIKYYNRIKDNKINNINYKIDSTKENNFINIKLKLIDNLPIKYNEIISINEDIFYNLAKNYYSYDSNYLLEDIYIVFNRYLIFSSGNNQSSILPSFKNILKEKLFINIELFASPLNTNSFKFGSFFYDCDYKFGSIGNYFNIEINKGYFELNPPFDSCIITEMFNKSIIELKKADNNKQPLLFCFIIPNSYFKYNQLNPLLNNFLSLNILQKKKDFLYTRLSRDFSFINTSSIVDTCIIICNTKYINDFVNNNLLLFKEKEKIF